MRVRWNHFQNGLQGIGQTAQCFNFRDVVVELCLCRQLAIEEQVCDLLEARAIGKVVDIVTSLRQSGTFLTNGAKMCFACGYAGQPTNFFLFCHCSLLIPASIRYTD